MAAGTLDRIPVDSITARAKEVRPGHAALTLIAAVLFGVGWVVCKIFAVLWLSAAWAWTATVMGWRQAAGKPDGLAVPRSELVTEMERLRLEVKRLGG